MFSGVKETLGFDRIRFMVTGSVQWRGGGRGYEEISDTMLQQMGGVGGGDDA